MDSHPLQRRPPSWLEVLLCLCVVAWSVATAYREVLSIGFVLDDHVLIEQRYQAAEGDLTRGHFGSDLWASGSDDQGSRTFFYRPLVTLSYALEWMAWDGSPTGFHLTNLLAHLAICLGLFLLLRRAGLGALTAAGLSALFGVAARSVEAVAWISGRTDVLAALFGVIGLLAHPGARLSRGRTALTALALIASLLCKEVGLAFVVAVSVIDLGHHSAGRLTRRTALWRLGVWWGAFGAYLAARLWASQGHPPPVVRLDPALILESFGRHAAVAVTFASPGWLLGEIAQRSWPFVALGVLVVAGPPILFARVPRTRQGSGPVAWAGALAAMLPVSNVVALGYPEITADRFAYVPLLFLALAAAPLVERLRPVWLRAVALVLLVGVGMVRTSAQVDVWRDELGLYARRAGTGETFSPRWAAVHADALSARARFVEAGEQWARIASWLQAHPGAENPSGMESRLELGLARVAEARGRFDEAGQRLERLSAATPGSRELVERRIRLALRAGQPDVALALLGTAYPRWGRLPSLTALEEVATTLRTRLSGMQRPGPEASPEALAEWARLFDELDGVAQARHANRLLLQRANAPAALRRQAAGYLVLKGEPAEARAALALLQEVGTPEEVEVLGALLRERLGE